MQIIREFTGLLVQPMRCHTLLRQTVLVACANLDFDRRAVRPDQGRMQRLVTVDLGDRNIVLELAGQRLVQRMQGTKRQIAIGIAVDHNPETVDVEHL